MLLVAMLRLLAWQVEPVIATWQLCPVFRDPSEDSRCTPAIAFLNLSLASRGLEQSSDARLSEAAQCRDQIGTASQATIVPTGLRQDTCMVLEERVWYRVELRVQVVAAGFPRK